MIELGSTNTPISAIQAAIDTGTTLSLGLYCSGGDTNFTHETEALASAITQYGTAFTDLIVGISVGSEDLYRNCVTTDGVGDTAANINEYILQTRAVLTNANLSRFVGHVDTYGIWTNPSIGGLVLPNVDFVGVDAYPY
jgi:glucan endo-1,3-beta-D-glucosidase